MLNFWKTIQSKKSSTLSVGSIKIEPSLNGDGIAPLKDFEFCESGM